MRILLYLLLLSLLINCSQKVTPPPTVRKSGDAFMPAKLPVKYSNMRNMLVTQVRVADMQRKISEISNELKRKYLTMSLDQLQKKFNATSADYQRLLRRIETTRKIELLAYEDLEVEDRTPANYTTRHHRAPAKPAGPPPKTIMISLPGGVPAPSPAASQEVGPVKTNYPRFPQMPSPPRGGATKQTNSLVKPK